MRLTTSVASQQGWGRRPLLRLVLLGAVLAAACGGGGSTGSGPAAGAQPSAAASSAGQADNGKASVIHVVLTGGPKPGSYDASSSKACTTSTVDLSSFGLGLGSEEVWDVGYGDSDITATTGLYVFSLTIVSSKTPALFTIGVTPHSEVALSKPGYDASTVVTDASAGGGGSGAVTVQDSGKTALITFAIKTAAGYAIEGTAKCNQVNRA